MRPANVFLIMELSNSRPVQICFAIAYNFHFVSPCLDFSLKYFYAIFM